MAAIKRTIITTLLLLLVILSVACEGNGYSSRTYEVDEVFRSFYTLLGGEENLGPAISQLHIIDGISYQFCSNVLLAYNPMAPESQQFYLHPLGNDLVQEKAITPAGPTENIDVYSLFKSKYKQMGDFSYLGRPITQAMRDPENGRTVQYFERAGFYQLDTDPMDMVHLLAYGNWKCASFCEYLSNDAANPRITPVLIDQPALRFFDPRFLGSPISKIYLAADGKLEQIFQNAVIFYDQSLPKGFGLRPLADILDFERDSLEAVSSDPEMGFVAIEGENWGFNVPYYFTEFIELNSKMAGQPVSRYKKISDNIYRQYFENIVLDYYPNAVDGFMVIPMSQGYNYQKKLAQIETQVKGVNTLAKVAIISWVNEYTLDQGQSQIFRAFVIDGQTPIPNAQMNLRLTFPDGSLYFYDLPLTGPDGMSTYTSEPLNVSANSTIEYTICLRDITGEKCSLKGSFLVWGE
jgi:hypothetical protein